MFHFTSCIIATVLAFCFVVSDATNRANVEVFAGVEEMMHFEHGISYNYKYDELLMRLLRARLDPVPISSLPRVESFSWKSCGSSSDLLIVNSLTLSPDPLVVPGKIGLTFDVTVQGTFAAPLKLVMELKKHEHFFWFHIPCVDDVGSCTYNDICQNLAGLTCPKPFDDNKIPCKCPFAKGRYTLPTSMFELNKSVPGGEYYVQAQLSDGSQAVNCIEIYFNIS